MSVAPLRPEHAAAAADLHARAFAKPWGVEVFAGYIADPGVVCLGAWAGAGMTAVVLAQSSGDEVEILTIAADPAARRRGYGRALVLAVMEAGRSRGATRCVLDVAHDNTAAIALYKALGFAEVGRRRAYYANGADGLVMAVGLA